MWNFSPKHVFTDSSGMFWRERRLPPGTYTDGQSIYEPSYRYRDGRNGMYRTGDLDPYLSKKSDKEKSQIMNKLKNDAPDVVLEL